MQNSTENPNPTPETEAAPKQTMAEMIAECEASGGRKNIKINSDGTTSVADVPQESFDRAVTRTVDEQIDERDLSRAQRRMRARKAKRPDLIQPVEIVEDGETEVWYLTALSDADVSSCGILMAADGFTLENLSSEEAQRSFNTALLSIGLVVSETDSSKYFEDVSEAKEFYDDPRNAGTSMALRTQLMELNPFFFGSKKKAPTIRLLPRAPRN